MKDDLRDSELCDVNCECNDPDGWLCLGCRAARVERERHAARVEALLAQMEEVGAAAREAERARIATKLDDQAAKAYRIGDLKTHHVLTAAALSVLEGESHDEA